MRSSSPYHLRHVVPAVLAAFLVQCTCAEVLWGASGPLSIPAPSGIDSMPAKNIILADSTAPPTPHDSSAHADAGPSFFGRLLNDVTRQATAPFSMNGGEAITTGGMLAVETGLLLSDRWSNTRAREVRRENEWVDAASPVITQMGGTAGFVGAGAFVGYSLLFGDDYDRRTSMMLGEAILTSSLWTRAVKFLAGRRRPSTFEDGKYDVGSQWMGVFQAVRNPDQRPSGWFDSFPSGHSTTAFAIATVFAERYNRTPVVPVIAYTLATLVGLSRMTENAHWASDVFAGSLVGYLCAKDVVAHNSEDAPYESGLPSQRSVHYTLGLAPLDAGMEVHMAIRF